MEAIDYTLRQIRKAKRKGEQVLYFYTVGDTVPFLNAVSSAPEVDKIIYDDKMIESSRCSERTKRMIHHLHKKGFKLGHGYIAILKS